LDQLPIDLRYFLTAGLSNATNATERMISLLNNTLSALNQTQAQLNISSAGNLSNFTVTNITRPTGNATIINATQVTAQVFRDLPASILVLLFSIVILISVPVVVDLVFAHRKGRRGLPGLYRALMTFGVIFIVGTIVVYLIALIAFNITIQGATMNALINILQNLGAILGTALASVIAFYFGVRGAESSAEKMLAAREREGGQRPLEVIGVSPIEGSQGEEITTAVTAVTATFNTPIRSSTVTPDNFRVEDETHNRMDGNMKLKDDNTTIEFKKEGPFNPGKTYYVIIPKGAITDLAGIPMASDKRWYFKTKPST
jgi:Bacterial Ig-like domain